MRGLGALYRRNLFRLATGPLAYVVGAGLALFASLHFFIGEQFFTEAGSTDLRHFFSLIPYACILAVPALTAALPAGDDAALPVRTAVVPVAKVLALLTALAVPLALTIVVPVAVLRFGDLDAALVACGYAGTVLYVIAVLAVTVFVFTLVPHTGAAFVAASVVLAATDGLHLAALYLSLPPWLSALCRLLSCAWHFDAAGKGILDTRDVVFYVAVAAFFTSASAAVTEWRRGNRSPSFLRTAGLAAAALVLAVADGSRLYVRADLTQNRQFSVSAYTRALLAELEEPLTITYYRSAALRDLYPQVRDVSDFLREYADASPHVFFSVADPAGEGMEERLAAYGIPGQQMQTAGRTTTSYTRVYAAVVADYLGGVEVIPFVLTTARLEYDLTSRVQALVRGMDRTVQVAPGNGMSLDADYGYVRPWLESQGFTVMSASLPSGDGGAPFSRRPRVPLVVLGTSQFTDEDTDALRSFITGGGTVFLATAPYTVDVMGGWDVVPSADMVPYMLQEFGVYFRTTLTADVSNFRLTLVSEETAAGLGAARRTEYVNYALWPVLSPQTHAPSGMTSFWPCALDTDAMVAADRHFEPAPYLVTSPAAWQYEKAGPGFVTSPFDASRVPQKDEQVGRYAVAVSLTRTGRDSPSLVVSGDQYALLSSMIAYSSSTSALDTRSLDFLSDSLLDMAGESGLLALKNRPAARTALYKVPADDYPRERRMVLAAVCLLQLAPITALAASVAVARRRRNPREVPA